MRLVAFAGPSLTSADCAAHSEVEWCAPAEAGDILRLRAVEGDIVCLIDGYFDHRPSVRHKELLLLLSRGVILLGSSSIGALRAAEMEPFGMIGMGAIYRAFASGRLQGDDEVALIHAAEERGWKALSLPLVDCRANLHRGLRAGSIAAEEAREVLRSAKDVHYADRDWRSVLANTAIAERRQRSILEWVKNFGVSQKRLDALACIAAATRGEFKKFDAPPMVRTSLFEALAAECGLAPAELR